MNPPTDEQLLAAHVRGDQTAFRTLVERHHQELFRFILRFTGSGAAAEDVTQEAFLQIHLASPSFDLERRLKPWLFTIAANKARDYLRTRTRRKEVPLDAPLNGADDPESQRFFTLLADDAPSAVENLEEAEINALVRNVVERMPPTLREVLVLAYFHNFPYKEMADILGIPLGTVKSRLHAAVAAFGKLFREQQNRHPPPDV